MTNINSRINKVNGGRSMTNINSAEYMRALLESVDLDSSDTFTLKTHEIEGTTNEGEKTFNVIRLFRNTRDGDIEMYQALSDNPETIRVKYLSDYGNGKAEVEVIDGFDQTNYYFARRPYRRRDGKSNPNVNLDRPEENLGWIDDSRNIVVHQSDLIPD